MNLDRLDGLATFVAVARAKSFTAAAGELEVTPPAVSQAVRQLEQRLGVRLFNRTTRSVGLTEAGARLLERVGPALAELDEAASLVAELRDRPAGLLRINTSRVAFATLIRPHLGDFLRAYPEIRVEIRVDEGFADIVGQEFDAGIRLGEVVERDMIGVPLGKDVQVVVAGSPAYFDRYGVPKTIADLKRHNCVRYSFPTSGGIYRWEFVDDGKPVEVEVSGSLTVNDSVLMTEAALDGIGLAYTFESHAAAHLAAGRLKSVLKRFCPGYPGFYLYYPSRRQLPLKLKLFVDFLKKRRL
ncbi:MAG TPA: LysR family transcriptional regulator [Burkholderiales bacterium]|nr:LysR family transcriptional regulator [Burkholderiales bacterium]